MIDGLVNATTIALSSSLPDLDQVPIWVAHVAANLGSVGLRLGEENPTLTSPLFVTRAYIRDTDIHVATDFVRVGWWLQSDRWLVVGPPLTFRIIQQFASCKIVGCPLRRSVAPRTFC